jgi:hypothetical protein
MVATSNVGTSIRIDWITPFNGGDPIIAYQVEILHKDGISFSSELTYCNARVDAVIIANKYCVIPTSTLEASPFLLVQGDIVSVRVLA